jgi:hypothetical protein
VSIIDSHGFVLSRVRRSLPRIPSRITAIRSPHPRSSHLDTTATERDLTVLVAVAHGSPVRIPLPPRAHDIVDLLGHQLLEHAEPDTHAQREQPFLRRPDQLPQRLLHALWEHSLITGRRGDQYVATHGGSSLDLWRIAANAPNTSGRGRRDRRHIKVLRAPGQPPPASVRHLDATRCNPRRIAPRAALRQPRSRAC